MWIHHKMFLARLFGYVIWAIHTTKILFFWNKWKNHSFVCLTSTSFQVGVTAPVAFFAGTNWSSIVWSHRPRFLGSTAFAASPLLDFTKVPSFDFSWIFFRSYKQKTILINIWNSELIKWKELTSVSSPLSICSRIICVYVRDATSGVFPPEIKQTNNKSMTKLDKPRKTNLFSFFTIKDE